MVLQGMFVWEDVKMFLWYQKYHRKIFWIDFIRYFYSRFCCHGSVIIVVKIFFTGVSFLTLEKPLMSFDVRYILIQYFYVIIKDDIENTVLKCIWRQNNSKDLTRVYLLQIYISLSLSHEQIINIVKIS